ATGTSTGWLTPPKRAVKCTASLSSSSRATARSAMFRTTRPSLIVCAGTRTPAWAASTRMCGVMPLSAIHSYSARSRYGRWLVMPGGVSGIASTGIRARRRRLAPVAAAGPSLRQVAQVLLLRRQAAYEAGVAEDAVAVFLDHLAVLGQRHVERRQAPDDRRHRAVGQAHFRVEEELAGLEQRDRGGEQF